MKKKQSLTAIIRVSNYSVKVLGLRWYHNQSMQEHFIREVNLLQTMQDCLQDAGLGSHQIDQFVLDNQAPTILNIYPIVEEYFNELPAFPHIAKDLHCHWGLKAEKNQGCCPVLLFQKYTDEEEF